VKMSMLVGLSPEDGDSAFLRNAGIYPKIHMALQRKRSKLTHSSYSGGPEFESQL
jgi:hypothetical protein